MGLVILAVVLMLAFRWRIYKVRKQMEEQFGEGFGRQSGPQGGFRQRNSGSPFAERERKGPRRRGAGAQDRRDRPRNACRRTWATTSISRRKRNSSRMLKVFELIGRYFMLMGKVFSRPEKAAIYRRRIVFEMEALGVNSIGLTAIISVFIGAVITLQMCINLDSPFIPRSLVGYATRETMILEFSSAVVALILAGKVGSSIASEIGTMRITEQIDALEIMGVNSASYLILPKIVAAMVFFPFLTILSILIGILGGYAHRRRDGHYDPRRLCRRPADGFQALFDHLHADQDRLLRLHHHLDFGLLRLQRPGQLAGGRHGFDARRGGQLRGDSAFRPDPDTSPAYMIRAEHIVKSFDGRVVLDDISVEFETGKTNLIIGRSGSGKTVLLKTLVGLHEPDSGDVWYDEVNFSKLGFRERKSIRKDIGMIFQGGALLDSSTVVENVRLPLDLFTSQSERRRRWSA